MKRFALVSLSLLGCTGELTDNNMPPKDADPIDPTGDGPKWADASGGASVNGTLTVTATSSPNGGPYAPRNIIAMWIMSPNGTFVKTILRWSAVRTQHLVAWGIASGGDADAVSGATRADHSQQLMATWDMKLSSGQLVGNGTYTVRMEMADSNANMASQNHQGTFTFLKSATPQTQSNLSNGGFSNVTLTFTPLP